MAQLTIEVNGRPYLVGCEDGQESHLRELARLFDSQVQQLSDSWRTWLSNSLASSRRWLSWPSSQPTR